MSVLSNIGLWTCVFYRLHRHGFWFSAWLCTYVSQLWKGDVKKWCEARHYHVGWGGSTSEMVLNEECTICKALREVDQAAVSRRSVDTTS